MHAEDTLEYTPFLTPSSTVCAKGSMIEPGWSACGLHTCPSNLHPSSTGALVGIVRAWDADQTEANNRISFSLSGTGVSNFILQGNVLEQGWAEGHLSLLPDVSLDYETQNVFHLTVSAENPGPQGLQSTANVTVVVLDLNDEPPTLDAASLQLISVAENGSQHGQVAQVEAWDQDTSAQLTVELLDVICTKAGVNVGSVCHSWFSVAANGSVYISESQAIDYEACHLVTLVVRAHDLATDAGFEAYSSNGEMALSVDPHQPLPAMSLVTPFPGFYSPCVQWGLARRWRAGEHVHRV